ncbi:NAD(P)/FAD-dependent oxidoreductase [Desulfogranum mediterraneum]|uniref:NAD(P)/FAD-dependent oxidoreductase n=1 Tax=Desulfogranum mediterraneum TaxID=160661 RepID=UPI000491CEB1|nr:FAD-dependent oxidoreductase [Desulfogranum mediterraneum]
MVGSVDRETDILIIGGGPGGLACAQELARAGREVLLLERKAEIGPKVCAGGITWSGLLQHVPEQLIQQAFPCQHIRTPEQHAQVRADQPIIATVDRRELGQWMAAEAEAAGARLLAGTRVRSIAADHLLARTGEQETCTIGFRQLIGADGANSLVRRSLGLSSRLMGVGLNANLPLVREQMEWHLNPALFRHGYAWIFPHGRTLSIGAYVDRAAMPLARLKANLISWARQQQITIPPEQLRAGLVNYDYQGHHFANRWLVGEAAGLASGLTGEGIYPAIVSGRAVARLILDKTYPADELTRMIRKQHRHHRVIAWAGRTPRLCGLLMNLLVLLLRIKVLDFRMLEMAD